jgi:glycosyltransferase involved in cell wall biosynthesis
MRRVLALVPSELGHSPGQRSTIELWERPLREAGFELEYAPFETPELRRLLGQRGRVLPKAREMLRAYSRRLRLVRDVRGFDAIYIYREAALIGPALLERWVARQGCPIVYSLDDPLYIPYISPSNGWLSYLKFFGKVATICRLSRVVIVNSRFHQDYAEKYNRNVRQIPSVVDERIYRYRPERPHGSPVCVGWSGSPSTVANLRLVTGALGELAKRVHYRLHLIGAERLEIPGVECTAQPWRAETEVSDLEQLDIGLVPLPDSEWNRRKFNLKLAQYMALGIVPVATPLGSNPDVIEHGVDGFLASASGEWATHLWTLVRDEALRFVMAERGALKARANFTLQAQSGAILNAFRSALPGGA